MPLPTYDKRLCKLREAFVEMEEKNIVFGNQKTWVDVEADEATFDKKDISRDPAFQRLIVKNGETIMWQQWGDVIQRGPVLRTLVLRKLIPTLTGHQGQVLSVRQSGRPSRSRSARSFFIPIRRRVAKRKVKGVLCDKVVHCKKRVKVTGKFR